MTQNRSLYRRAREAAAKRRHLLGEEPPATLKNIFATPERRTLSRSIYLVHYLVFGGALSQLRFFITYLADRDTPFNRRRILRLKERLTEQLSSRCRISEAFLEREYYGRDIAVVPRLLLKALYRCTPWLVLQPNTVEDLKKIFQFATSRKIAITVRGAASSAFGAVIPTRNGIVLDLSQLNKVVSFNPEAAEITVEAGIRWAELDSFLLPYGLTTPVCPSSRFSTIGGWLASGGVGLNSFGAGLFGQQVSLLSVLHPNGEQSLIENQDDLAPYLGSEGQLGVFTTITLKVCQRAAFSGAVLFSFKDLHSCSAFLLQLYQSDFLPRHVVLYDRHRLVEENLLFRDRTAKIEQIVPERDCILLHFEDQKEQSRFLNYLGDEKSVQLESNLAARYLWEERFFPLKAQRIGPNLLAVEVLLAEPRLLESVAKQLRKLARRFGLEGALEFITAKGTGPGCGVVIFSYPADAKRPLLYLFELLFVQLALISILRFKSRPYGYGIWNAPFFGLTCATSERAALRSLKSKFDPQAILNPGKFFSVQGRSYGLSSILFHRTVLLPALRLGLLFSPAIGLLYRCLKRPPAQRWIIPEAKARQGRTLLAETIQRCTFCGACVAVCPAYQLSKDEFTTGRAKLFLADRLLSKRESRPQEHFRPFQCLRCGLCEEVCQTRLPLLQCYDTLEQLTVARFRSFPTALVQGFLKRVDQERSWLLQTFGLNLADWAPIGMTKLLPGARPDLRSRRVAPTSTVLAVKSSGEDHD